MERYFKETEFLFNKVLSQSKRVYGKRLVTLAIFGSFASGENIPESDIDILVIADSLSRKRLDRVDEFGHVEKSLERSIRQLRQKGINTYLSPIFKTPEEVKKGSLLFLDMLYDIIFLYDKEQFFSNYLKDLRKKLNKLGAKRIERGKKWYWVLKPDYKQGETFEI